MRRIGTEEITIMLVVVIDGVVMGFVDDGRIHVRGPDGVLFVYGHIDENAEYPDE